MQKQLSPAERLIIAADFRPTMEEYWSETGPCSGSFAPSLKRDWVKARVLSLADSLKGTGVYLKVNSALRACGYDLIGEIQSRGLRVFADLKLYDIGETLATDGALLKEARPELLTVVCSTGRNSIEALKAELPDTELLGVTILTNQKDKDMYPTYGRFHVQDMVNFFAELGVVAGVDGVICSASEASTVRAFIGENKTINTPAIRPTWAIVPGDDQNPERIMTPAKAIKEGADRIMVGRPIVKAENPYDAAMRTIEEIASATA
ncbi:MAG: orotidine-5'-phosphate decarboxylase [Patescibacteria group bacterium]